MQVVHTCVHVCTRALCIKDIPSLLLTGAVVGESGVDDRIGVGPYFDAAEDRCDGESR